MTYDVLLQTVINSRPDDWAVLTPPTVEQLASRDGSGAGLYVDGHPYVATHRPNLEIGLAWGKEQREWEGIWTSWSPFPDQSVIGEYLEVQYQGRPIVRQLVVSADGGRYLLPAPHVISGGDGKSVVGWYVDSHEVPLARLAHDLSNGGEDFDSGMQAAKFQIR